MPQGQLSVRMPSEYIEELEIIAKEEDRSLTAEVRRLIRSFLTERGRLSAAA